MGYRVGYQCFLTSEAAHDYLLSQQLPTITADGQIIRPVRQGNDWYLQGQKVQLSLPECSVPNQIIEGGLAAAPFIFLAVLVFGFKQIIYLIKSMTQVGIDDD